MSNKALFLNHTYICYLKIIRIRYQHFTEAILMHCKRDVLLKANSPHIQHMPVYTTLQDGFKTKLKGNLQSDFLQIQESFSSSSKAGKKGLGPLNTENNQ